jgi:hypothetical protein
MPVDGQTIPLPDTPALAGPDPVLGVNSVPRVIVDSPESLHNSINKISFLAFSFHSLHGYFIVLLGQSLSGTVTVLLSSFWIPHLSICMNSVDHVAIFVGWTNRIFLNEAECVGISFK